MTTVFGVSWDETTYVLKFTLTEMIESLVKGPAMMHTLVSACTRSYNPQGLINAYVMRGQPEQM